MQKSLPSMMYLLLVEADVLSSFIIDKLRQKAPIWKVYPYNSGTRRGVPSGNPPNIRWTMVPRATHNA